MLSLGTQIKTWIFFIGGESLWLPMIFGRLMNKNILLLLPGSPLKAETHKKFSFIFKIRYLITQFNRTLSKFIIIYSNTLIYSWDLDKYTKKILVADRHFLDFKSFQIFKPLKSRRNVIGYIGSLDEAKGISNLIKAILILKNKTNDLEFMICGKGSLEETVTKFSYAHPDLIKYVGWIDHGNVSFYLNKFKILVLPSYSEGLPNIILESMACGTPVLATTVGAIPDVIKDEDTGFLMKSNSPECIAKNILRAIEFPDLEKIGLNAYILVKREFTYEKAVERWKEIIENYIE